MRLEAFDHAVIGGGPAGLTAALELSRCGSVVLLEKGPSVGARECPAHRLRRCEECTSCSVLSGLGGASGTLGGKLCLFPAGARLASHVGSTMESANSRSLNLLARMGLAIPSTAGRLSYELVDRIHFRDYVSIPVLAQGLGSLFRRMIRTAEAQGCIIKSGTSVEEVSRRDGGGFSVAYSSA